MFHHYFNDALISLYMVEWGKYLPRTVGKFRFI